MRIIRLGPLLRFPFSDGSIDVNSCHEPYSAEALKMTGLLDDLPALSEEQSDVIAKAKKHILRTTEDYRIQIRKTLSQEGLQNFFDNEKMAAIGLAGGAVAGAIL